MTRNPDQLLARYTSLGRDAEKASEAMHNAQIDLDRRQAERLLRDRRHEHDVGGRQALPDVGAEAEEVDPVGESACATVES